MLSYTCIVRLRSFFFLMIRRPPRSTLFPTRRSSDLLVREGRWFSRLAARVPSSRENLKRSEEHTSELQSRGHLVCRLLLGKEETLGYTAQAIGAAVNDHLLSGQTSRA